MQIYSRNEFQARIIGQRSCLLIWSSNDLECGPNLTKSAEQEHQQRLRNTQITPNRTVATPQAGEEAEQGGMSVDQLRQEAFAK